MLFSIDSKRLVSGSFFLLPNPQRWKRALALGHDYWQSGHRLSRFEQAEIAGAGHSDYWGWVQDTRERCAVPTGRAVRSFLKLVWLGEAAVASAEISDRVPGVRTESSRDLGYRRLAERAL